MVSRIPTPKNSLQIQFFTKNPGDFSFLSSSKRWTSLDFPSFSRIPIKKTGGFSLAKRSSMCFLESHKSSRPDPWIRWPEAWNWRYLDAGSRSRWFAVTWNFVWCPLEKPTTCIYRYIFFVPKNLYVLLVVYIYPFAVTWVFFITMGWSRW